LPAVCRPGEGRDLFRRPHDVLRLYLGEQTPWHPLRWGDFRARTAGMGVL